MKRKNQHQVEAPDYPTLQAFRENRKAVLKVVGAGAVGLAITSCRPEPPMLGGVPPMPPAEAGSASDDSGSSAHQRDGSVHSEEVHLGGVVCPPENLKR
jgi:hypothetical protein